MKRYISALATVLALGFFGLSSSNAQAAVQCHKSLNGGAYPEGYLWYCDPDLSHEQSVITGLAHLGNSVGVTDAKTKLSNANHYIFIFASLDDYATYVRQANNPTPTPRDDTASIADDVQGYTYTFDNVTFTSVTFDDKVATATADVANITVHEVGHQLDYLYGVQLYGAGQVASAEKRDFALKLTGLTATIGGTPNLNDTVTLTFAGALLAAPVNVSYQVPTNTTSLADIALGLVNKINATIALTKNIAGDPNHSINVYASVQPGQTVITVTSTAVLTYSQSVTHGSSPSFESVTLSNHDWPSFIARTPQCSPSNGGAFVSKKDAGVFFDQPTVAPVYMCGTLQTIKIRGAPQVNEIYTVTVTDPAIAAPHTRNVTYKVPSSPTPSQTTVTNGLIAAVNADVVLQPLRITSKVGTSDLQITSGTQASTFTVSKTAGTGTIALSGGITLNGDTLSKKYYGQANDVALQAA